MLLQERSPMKKHPPLEQQYHAQSSGKHSYPAESQCTRISLSGRILESYILVVSIIDCHSPHSTPIRYGLKGLPDPLSLLHDFLRIIQHKLPWRNHCKHPKVHLLASHQQVCRDQNENLFCKVGI